MSNRHQELASLEQTDSALAILGQTTTGKELSNPLMADSLPKTIQSNDPPLSRGYTLGSREDNLKLMELMEFVPKLCYLAINSLLCMNLEAEGKSTLLKRLSLLSFLELPRECHDLCLGSF
ncbi:hypothetical protein Tco_0650173 [Tanacetum coccineum]